MGLLLHAAESTPVPALNVTIMHTGNAGKGFKKVLVVVLVLAGIDDELHELSARQSVTIYHPRNAEHDGR